jgi:hypothetical protein
MILDELEKKLRPPERLMPPYPPKYIVVASGQPLVIRQARHDDFPTLLEAVEPLARVRKDFYDIVASRMYAELLGQYIHRVVDPYCLVGTINGVIASIVNGRMIDAKRGMSYHTLTIHRGLRCGAHMFAAKMEYHMEYLGQEEVFIVAESFIGFKRWMIEYQLESRPDFQHELGGAPSYVLTRALYDLYKPRLVAGTRPVPPEILATADELILPDEYPQIPGFKR